MSDEINNEMKSERHTCNRCGYQNKPYTPHGWESFLWSHEWTRICPSCVKDLKEWVYDPHKKEDALVRKKEDALVREIRSTFIDRKRKRWWQR